MLASFRRIAAVALVTVWTLVACSDTVSGSIAPAPDDESAQPTMAPDADPEFCADLAELAETLERIASDLSEPGAPEADAISALFDSAADELEAVTPPEEMESDWEVAIDGLRQFADTYRGVDVSDPESVEAFQDRLEELEETSGESQAAIDRISAYARETCAIDLGASG